MEIKLPTQVAKDYHSNSQKIRVMTEYWVKQMIFCPNCGNLLDKFGNNTPVADFYCSKCSEQYELKAKDGGIKKKIVDGAYSTMIQRLDASNNPNFFFLSYDKTTFKVKNFLTIPKYFFIKDIIEQRKPLAPTARRAGWIGCNIVLNSIPEFGKIFYVQDGIIKEKSQVLKQWNRTDFVKNAQDVEAKGWLLDILICIEKIRKKEFSLDEVYNFERQLKTKHSANNNVQAKIRQQLQILRDRGVIEFVGRGRYRMKNPAL